MFASRVADRNRHSLALKRLQNGHKAAILQILAEEPPSGLGNAQTRDRGFAVGPEFFLLTNGSAGAIDQICGAFVTPGDVIITEAPTFSGTLRTFRGHSAEIVPIGMDEHGMRVDELEPLIESLTAQGKRVKLIYTISNFHNPMGVTLSLPRREELLRIAARYGAFVLDDDAYGELHFPGWDRRIPLLPEHKKGVIDPLAACKPAAPVLHAEAKTNEISPTQIQLQIPREHHFSISRPTDR